MLANELIDLLERRGLLDQEIIEALRDQLAQSGAKVTPEAVAKLLVDNKHLTRFQATKLIGELRSGEYESEADAVQANELADDLDLLDDNADDGEEVMAVLDEDDDIAEAIAIDDDEVAEAVMVEDDDVAVAVAVDDDEIAEAVAVDGSGPNKTTARRKPQPDKNVWDSFKIYGVAGIILMLIVSGFGLWWVISGQDAGDFIKNADSLYDSTSYAEAREQYESFVNSYGTTDPINASKARVRIATTKIYEAVGNADPTDALTVAKAELPAVQEEQFMADERPALADTLVAVGENIANKAEDAEQTEEKKTFLAGLDDLIAMTQNAKFVTSVSRQSLATRLTQLDESRARINRTINRNIRLDETVAAMTKFLEGRETKPAYNIRKSLLRDYPELEDNESLQTLIEQASGIQQELVESLSTLPELLTSDPLSSDQKTIVLTNRVGPGVPGLAGRVVYFQVRGSVLAFAADTGQNLWRRFVGYRDSHLPTPLGERPEEGVLLSDGARGEVQRLSGDTGEMKWRSVIGEAFNPPQVEGENVFLSTNSGRVLALDSFSGEVQWGIQLPQETQVPPGVLDRSTRLYQVGNHSNLYVLDGKTGKAIESYYLGHTEGSVRVSPVALLGHLFVVENIDPKNSRIHVLRMNESGDGLVRAQAPILLTGNVITPPKQQRRRLIVLTDRGQVKVLDIEPTAENEQVTVMAEQVASYESPTATQMEVDQTQMWVTGTRVNRYELQMSTGRIVFSWTKHAGDSFIAPPKMLDDILFHARILKGTKGVRVTAVDPTTGDMRWQNDVGVPVSMLTPTKGGVHAITSQAGLYMLDGEAYREGISGTPIENPGGQDSSTLRFENPFKVTDDVTLLLNKEDSGQLAVYNPTRRSETLRIIKLNIGLAKATAPPIATAGGLMLALNNGRILLKNFQTGVNLGSPFQPSAPPEADIDWYDLVPLPNDPEQIVLGDDRGKLFRIRAGDQLRALTEVENPIKFLGTMTAIDDTLFATTGGPAADVLLRYDINKLTETGRTTLEGRVLWGPVRMDQNILIQTDDGKLRAMDAKGEAVWTLDIPPGVPVAPPTLIAGQWVMAGEPGWLLAIDPATGKITGQIDFGEPLSAAPLPVGANNRLFVPGSEGVIYITDLPTGGASE